MVCSEEGGSGGLVLQLLRAEVQRWRDAWIAGDGEGGKRPFVAVSANVRNLPDVHDRELLLKPLHRTDCST